MATGHRGTSWYKDAVIYEVPVQAFADANGDGIGDLPGLTGKLDYLLDLGVTAIWLLPFYPSVLRDDGYDVTDYTAIHPAYGTIADFRRLLEESHRRGLRIITELVLNHTSDRHPWFQRARRAPPGSVARDFYVWSDSPHRYPGARIIFSDCESSNWSWDPVAGAFYWHRFFRHQPDLNFDSPAVRRAIFEVVDFWLGMGVDGLRLDAVPFLFEREGTSCENLPQTHGFLKDLRAHVDRRFPRRMLLAEANQRPEEAAAYFGQGDEAHMAFHFPLMPRMFLAAALEDRAPIVDVLSRTTPIPPDCQWALFLRNHDELSLEMVSDEEREGLYRAYSGDARTRLNLGIRRRLAPLLGNDRGLIELMTGLLFSLPGSPVIYYGDEIGMGDDLSLPDRYGIRTPMQWGAGPGAGFSPAPSDRLYLPVILDHGYGPGDVSVDAQRLDAASLWHWIRRLIALRKRFPVLGRGALRVVETGNRRVLGFLRKDGAQQMLVLANLARTDQEAEVDLAPYREAVAREVLGDGDVALSRSGSTRVSLAPHRVMWLSLHARRRTVGPEPPVLEAAR